MLLKLVPFKSWGAVSYSPSIVTVTVSVVVCELFSVKEWCDFENRIRVCSRSLEMAPFDRSHMRRVPISWRYLVSFARYSELLVQSREIIILHLYLVLPKGVTLSEFREYV